MNSKMIKCYSFMIGMGILVLFAFTLVYHYIYFFDDSVTMNVSENNWTKIFLCDEREYTNCIEIVNHAMNEYDYDVRYIDTDTNEVLETTRIKAGTMQKSILQGKHNIAVEVKKGNTPISGIRKNSDNVMFHITYYPNNFYSRFLSNIM